MYSNLVGLKWNGIFNKNLFEEKKLSNLKFRLLPPYQKLIFSITRNQERDGCISTIPESGLREDTLIHYCREGKTLVVRPLKKKTFFGQPASLDEHMYKLLKRLKLQS